MCLTDTSGPTVFLPKNELGLTLPPKNPPQTHDLIRDTLELLVMLEYPRARPVAEVVKGLSASGCWRRSWVLQWDWSGGRRRWAWSCLPGAPDPVPLT